MTSIEAISDFLFVNRREIFTRPDLVIFHPGHYKELNEDILRLYHEEGFSFLTLSGAPNSFMGGKSEYEVHKPFLMAGGVPEETILLEPDGKTIEEIVRNSFLIPSRYGLTYQTALLVGKSFFARRLLLMGELFAPEDVRVDVLGLSDRRGITRTEWMNSEIGRQRVSGEFKRISSLLSELNHYIPSPSVFTTP